jgi:hypothetical protein
MMNHDSRHHYVPLLFFVLYIALSLGLALFGPIIFVDFPKNRVIAYICFIISCCVFGYYLGIRSSERSYPLPEVASSIVNQTPVNPLNYTLIVSVVGLGAYFVGLTLSGGLNTNVMALGEAYATSYQDYQRNSGSYTIPFLVYSALAAPVYICSVWGLLYFSRLSKSKKLLVVAVLVGNVIIFTLGSGKMKQAGDLVIYLIAVGAIRRAQGGRKFSTKAIVALTTIGLLGVCAFAFIASQRYSVMGVDIFNVNLKTSWRIKYDSGHPVFAIFGPKMGFALALMAGYLGQGYYGLGLTLESSHTWSHFLGTSYSMSVLAERFVGIPSGYYISYPYLTGVETGWGESHWYTVFPWFASDFTFIGTGAVFAFFAFWYARSWFESTELGDPYSVLLFALFAVGVFYVPANNQLMQSPGGLATVVTVIALYIATGRRRRQLKVLYQARQRSGLPGRHINAV